MTRIADSHVHIRFDRDEEIERMLDTMKSVGVEAACILSLPYRTMTDNLAAVWQKTVRKDMDIRAFGGIHVNDRCADITPEIQVQKLLELGCDGIKLMCSPDLRRYMKSGFDSPKYSKMFGLLEECEIPMNIHIADPEDFWDEGKPYANGLFPSKKQIYEEIFRVLDAHPKLRVTFAHFFFLSNFPEEAERVMEKYPNVCFDITPGVEMYYNFDKKIDVWHDFFTKYSNRILFGTDCNANKTCNDELVELVRRKITENRDVFTQHCYGKDFIVRGLYLDKESAERILYRNFYDRLGENKPVDLDKFYEYCEIMKRSLENDMSEPERIIGAEIDLGGKTYSQIALEFLNRRLV